MNQMIVNKLNIHFEAQLKEEDKEQVCSHILTFRSLFSILVLMAFNMTSMT